MVSSVLECARQAAEAVSKLRQPDLTSLWQRFLDAEPELPVGDFPAWLLLQEPGLALQLANDLPAGETDASQGYRCVHRWTQARRAKNTSEELAVRKALQASHPALFEVLKQTVRK